MPRKSGKSKSAAAGAKSKAKAPRKRSNSAEVLEPRPVDSDDSTIGIEGAASVRDDAGDHVIELSDFRPLESDGDDAGTDATPAIPALAGDADDRGALVPLDPLNR